MARREKGARETLGTRQIAGLAICFYGDAIFSTVAGMRLQEHMFAPIEASAERLRQRGLVRETASRLLGSDSLPELDLRHLSFHVLKMICSPGCEGHRSLCLLGGSFRKLKQMELGGPC